MARYADPDVVQQVGSSDTEWRALEFQVNQHNKVLNQLMQQIGAKKRAGEDCAALLTEVATVKQAKLAKEQQRDATEQQVAAKLRLVGNLVHESVPVSKSEDHNQVVRVVGVCKRNHARYHHHELLHMIDGYSAERGVKVAGHRGYFLKGVGVMLSQVGVTRKPTHSLYR